MVVFSAVNPRGCSLCTGDSQTQSGLLAPNITNVPFTGCSKTSSMFSNVYRNMKWSQCVQILTVYLKTLSWAGIAQSVERLPRGWTVRGSKLGVNFLHPSRQALKTTQPHTMDTGSFPPVKRLGRGANHPLPRATRLKKEWTCTSTSLLCLHGRL